MGRRGKCKGNEEKEEREMEGEFNSTLVVGG